MKSEFAHLLIPNVGNEVEQDVSTTKHSHIGRKGDLVIELHYGDLGTGHGRQAALYIHKFGKEEAGAFIPLHLMWMYAERESLHVMIPPLAKQIYGFVTRMDELRVLDAVIDYLDDLRKSKPDPNLFKDKSLDRFLESCAEEGLDFSATVNGKKVVG